MFTFWKFLNDNPQTAYFVSGFLMLYTLWILTAIVMLRLCVMRERPFQALYPEWERSQKLGTDERLLIFFVSVFVICGGYFIQPVIENWLSLSWASKLSTIGDYWGHTLVMGLAPGSITAYALISAKNQRSMFLRGCIVSFCALSAIDMLSLITNSYRSLLFSVGCNFIGGPIAVAIVLMVRRTYRSYKRRRKE